MSYINPLPDPQSPDDFVSSFLAFLAANIPNWKPSDGDLETWLAYAAALQWATVADSIQSVAASIFRYFGASLLAPHLPFLAPIEAVPATVLSTWTAIDTLGHTIPAGTRVAFQVAADTLIGFTVDTDTPIATGGATATNVALTADVAGTAANGLNVPIVPVDDLAWVSSVTAIGQPAGGVDAETDDAYLNRLSSQLPLLSPRVILAADAALFVLNTPGVARAMGVDLYSPGPPPVTNMERAVTVAVADSAGAACSSSVKAAALADLQAQREPNFLFWVVDPTYTTVNVSFTGHALIGYDAAAVQAAAEATVTAFLDPANWGPDAGPWPSTVYLLDVVSVLTAVPGFTFAAGGGVTLNGSAADVTLSGAFPLPTVGTVAGTVT